MFYIIEVLFVVVLYIFFIYAIHRVHIVSSCAMILNMLEEKMALEHVGPLLKKTAVQALWL